MPQLRNPKVLTPINTANTKKSSSRPNSSPIALQGIDLSSIEGSFPLSSLPPLPSSPPPTQQSFHPSQDLFKSNIDGVGAEEQSPPVPPKPGKDNNSTTQTQDKTWQGQWHVKDDDDVLQSSSSSMSKIYHLRQAPGSTPELSLVGSADSVAKPALEVSPLATNKPQSVQQSIQDLEQPSSNRRTKAFRNPLTRTKSAHKASTSSRSNATTKPPNTPPKSAPMSTSRNAAELLKPKTKEKRGKSTERSNSRVEDSHLPQQQSQTQNHIAATAQPHRERERSNFLTGSKNALSKAKTGGGNFLTRIGKIGRSGSSNEKETTPHVEEVYTLKVINLPLVEQTRITRISKSLDACKDKTEFWMPSLPWRCIDYLNSHCESEGLYRIPGSGPQIKQWQRRFDTELDIDLFEEQDLYDPNNISSLLKQWLRELPTEIIPSDLQASLALELEKDNPDYSKMGQPAPQALRDALSELPPFNYYLLFAITCHLSLLFSHQDRNRMDLNNLSICIGPCLKLERWLFNYLVGDWRHCWQGCWTEKQTLEAENRIDEPDHGSEDEYVDAPNMDPASTSPPTLSPDVDDRTVSSGAASMVSAPLIEDSKERPATAATSTSSRPQTSRGDGNNHSASTPHLPLPSGDKNP